MATATAGLSLGMLGASALDGEACLGPKPALTDNVLHTFKPPRIVGVVIWEIERLPFSCQWVDAIAHAWPIQLVRPKALGISGDCKDQNK